MITLHNIFQQSHTISQNHGQVELDSSKLWLLQQHKICLFCATFSEEKTPNVLLVWGTICHYIRFLAITIWSWGCFKYFKLSLTFFYGETNIGYKHFASNLIFSVVSSTHIIFKFYGDLNKSYLDGKAPLVTDPPHVNFTTREERFIQSHMTICSK